MSDWQMTAARLVLELREVLVRHDENLKARVLMDQCVPYIAEGRRDIEQAKADQEAMTRHLFDEQAMRDYYATNVYDAPFEDNYGLSGPQEALERIPRFSVLAQNLPPNARVLDLACNDGIMAAAIEGARQDVTVSGCDLSPAAVERAKARGTRGKFTVADLHTLDRQHHATDVVAFEVIEHVVDPAETLKAMTRHDPDRIWVSTPNGAMEQGNLPGWDHVEPKGHVRALTPQNLLDLLHTIVPEGRAHVALLPDRTMLGKATLRDA